jgi:hypothetical protein
MRRNPRTKASLSDWPSTVFFFSISATEAKLRGQSGQDDYRGKGRRKQLKRSRGQLPVEHLLKRRLGNPVLVNMKGLLVLFDGCKDRGDGNPL